MLIAWVVLVTISCQAGQRSENGVAPDDDPVMGYLALADGDLSVEPLYDAPRPSSEGWRELVEGFRAKGLMGINEQQRRVLLVGSLKAYAITTRSLNWNVAIVSGGMTTTGQVYETFTADGSLHLEARSTSFDGNVRFDWGNYPFTIEAPARTILLIDAGRVEYWTSSATSPWECSSSGASDMELMRLSYLGMIGGFVDGSVLSQDSENIVLDATLPDDSRIRYTLSAKTLWPRQIAVDTATSQPLVVDEFELTLTERNGTQGIDRPKDVLNCG